MAPASRSVSRAGSCPAVDEYVVNEPKTLGGPVRNHQFGGDLLRGSLDVV